MQLELLGFRRFKYFASRIPCNYGIRQTKLNLYSGPMRNSDLKIILKNPFLYQQGLAKILHLPRFHVPFWLSHILVYLFYLCPSFCPS